MALHAYRFFSGTCRDAMTNYQTVFGGTLEMMTFAELSAGGEVQMPYEPTFWALRFGACVDRFGTSWMVSVDHPEAAAE